MFSRRVKPSTRAVEDLVDECGGVGLQPLADSFEAFVDVPPQETCMDDEQRRQHEDEYSVEEHDEHGHGIPHRQDDGLRLQVSTLSENGTAHSG